MRVTANKKKRQNKILQLRKIRDRKKRRYSGKNLAYQQYIKSAQSDIPEWAYNGFIEDSV